MFRKEILIAVLMVCSLQMAAMGDAVVISDDFDRADNTDLGSTDQGYTWLKYDAETAKPVIASNKLSFASANNTIYLQDPVAVKDFVASFQWDYTSGSSESGRYFKFNFRNTSNGAFLDLGGTQSGYELRIDAYSNSQVRVQIYSEYGGTLATGYVDGGYTYITGAHDITLKAVGNSFEVYVDDTDMSGSSVISLTDNSANPGKDAEGYFAMNMNAYRACTIDNFVVTPEPATIALLGAGGLGLIVKRRKNR